MKGNPPLHGLSIAGNNMIELVHGSVKVLYSYETPVAVMGDREMFQTEQGHSKTTSKHINQWFRSYGLDPRGAKRIPQADINRMAESGSTGAHRPRQTGYHGNPRRATQYAELGSISSGTMRPEDLIPEFVGALEYEYQRTHRTMSREVKQLIRDAKLYDPDNPGDDDNDLVDELISALEELAPPYAYFGASEGDGADFGFWLSNDSIDMAIHDNELLKVDDLSEVPSSYTGEVLEVNDHGNRTLYFKSKSGRYKEVWSIV